MEPQIQKLEAGEGTRTDLNTTRVCKRSAGSYFISSNQSFALFLHVTLIKRQLVLQTDEKIELHDMGQT